MAASAASPSGGAVGNSASQVFRTQGSQPRGEEQHLGAAVPRTLSVRFQLSGSSAGMSALGSKAVLTTGRNGQDRTLALNSPSSKPRMSNRDPLRLLAAPGCHMLKYSIAYIRECTRSRSCVMADPRPLISAGMLYRLSPAALPLPDATLDADEADAARLHRGDIAAPFGSPDTAEVERWQARLQRHQRGE